MCTSPFSNSPAVTALDNRGLTVHDIAYYRHPDIPEVTSMRITRYRYDARGFLTQSADPRLHELGLANFSYLTNLAGNVLCSQGVDSGITFSLNDAAGRQFIAVSNIGTTDEDTEDLCQAVTRTWQYEDATLSGQPLSITEQLTGEAACITERFVYAGNTDAEKSLNLALACVSHYDTAGLLQTDSVALTGVPLAVTRCVLKDADNTDVMADWQGGETSAWNDVLAGESEGYTTLTTADAAGTVLTTTDAQGNMQRVAYDVAGQLSGSWLTLKGGTEQAIVQSLTYSAAGQKLHEKHGNGVVTTYAYEPQTQRLVRIKTARPTGHASGVKVLQDLRYEYDPVGNVLKITNIAEETRFWHNQEVVPENTYTYDTLYQLVSASGREMANAGQQCSSLPPATIHLPTDSSAYTNYTRTYSYDNAGNLTQIHHSSPATGNNYTTAITVSDRSNRGVLSTLTPMPSEVDALFTAGGQQKQLQSGQSLVWTPRNELLQVTPVVRDGSADDRESYRYDGSSQRLLKVSMQKTNSSQQTQRVHYLPGLELRTTSTGNTETERLQVITVGEAGRAQVRALHWESGKPPDIRNGQLRYSYDNLTGSSLLELDGNGNIISMEEYYPYGGTAVWTARSATEANYKTARYSGKERDATGLYYYGYRYYQPWVGRWLSADPAGTVDGLNLFRMVRNNPLRYFDKDGLAPNEGEFQQKNGRNYIKEAKYLAAEQLSVAEKFLNNSSNNEVALDIYKTFFGLHMGEEKLGIWKTQIKSVLEGVNKLDTKRNIQYSPLKITASGETSQSVAAEVDTQAFQRGEKIYMNAYTDILGKVKKNETLGVDHLAHILIHEISHLRLNTEDKAYIGVVKNEGYHELNGMLALLEPDKLPTSKGEREETILQRRTRGSLDALKNADSFTTATRYLAYAAKNANSYSYFSQQKKNFKPGSPALIASPRWKSL
ncbi:insecticidal toxin complex protein TccC [Pantoea agglomerans]|uniref:RHS repeat protein n=1 Tax=Enterobacter agglomerans TaxID=549 RepID=UPI0013BE8496|nr:RHS repeat domain-containing protein [Pantoea agglomerans]MDQ0431012.1 insecticidal toxin complex protein TccC [Pantoea agglomerans]NEG84416.1 RHS repeat protein [Pantoea agglomerans]NEH06341.1 RHS repeat protein [Pantoea agglomerans]